MKRILMAVISALVLLGGASGVTHAAWHSEVTLDGITLNYVAPQERSMSEAPLPSVSQPPSPSEEPRSSQEPSPSPESSLTAEPSPAPEETDEITPTESPSTAEPEAPTEDPSNATPSTVSPEDSP